MEMHNDLEASRTQLKKEAANRQEIGEHLTTLSDDQLHRMELPRPLMKAIQALRPMKSHGARRRQMQYIGTLMRHIDREPIEQALFEIEQGAYQQAKAFQRIEKWREQLIGGDEAIFKKILADFPQANRQRLGQLVRSARKEREKKAAPKSARNLFRYLKALSDGG